MLKSGHDVLVKKSEDGKVEVHGTRNFHEGSINLYENSNEVRNLKGLEKTKKFK